MGGAGRRRPDARGTGERAGPSHTEPLTAADETTRPPVAEEIGQERHHSRTQAVVHNAA